MHTIVFEISLPGSEVIGQGFEEILHLTVSVVTYNSMYDYADVSSSLTFGAMDPRTNVVPRVHIRFAWFFKCILSRRSYSVSGFVCLNVGCEDGPRSRPLLFQGPP